MLIRCVRCCVLALIAFSLTAIAGTDPDQIWSDFIQWVRAQPGAAWPPIDLYRAKLIKDGLTAAQADERIAAIPKIAESNPKYRQAAMEAGYDKLYRSPQQTRFTVEPNAFLVSTIRTLKPGKALDVAMGQGRNAVYVAKQGWDVTGFDVSTEALKAAACNAENAGTHLSTAKANFTEFDYGTERWDLIYFVYTDAPIVDPKYVERIVAALKPGGMLLIDRPFRSIADPEPGWPETEQDKPNALTKAWSGLQIVFYEDTTGIADWQQTSEDRLQRNMRIVRLLARKL